MIRKTLRRLGWRPAPEATLPLLPRADPPAPSAAVSESPADPIPPPETPQAVLQEPPEAKPATPSFDPNPLDRSLDRLLAALGRLDDAQPLFAPAQNLPRAGVLLAIPALVASGLLPAAEKIYESLRPSFYGLRTTLVAYVLLALLRIRRPEALKEYSPGELGRIVGLDRMPEVKTLRRKLSQLAKTQGQLQTRPGNRPAPHPRTRPRRGLSLRGWSCAGVSRQTYDSQRVCNQPAIGRPGHDRLLDERPARRSFVSGDRRRQCRHDAHAAQLARRGAQAFRTEAEGHRRI